ncbi:MAG: hypothetical protein KJ709_07650 [Nanoarchaeota archaeon]|nr:hypothetical protein [Nanoarchaeota archaeon]
MKQLLKLKSKQRLAMVSLQQHLSMLRMKEYLTLTGIVVGSALLRVPMQALPSVEPISFFSFLSGWLFGKKKGFIAGVSALALSNFFVMGGQGPWTIPMALGFGIIGAAGGFLRKRASVFETITVMVIATAVYEVVVNVGSLIFFPAAFPLLFITAAPFTLIHILSNGVFSAFLPKAKQLAEKAGHFHEREIAKDLIAHLKKK